MTHPTSLLSLNRAAWDAVRLTVEDIDVLAEAAASAGDAAVYEAMRSETFDPSIPDNVAEYVGNAIRAALRKEQALMISEEPQRKKTSYVGVPAIFELTMACNVLIRGYGASIYHVGSSLQRPDWRDVDLVMILSDEAFEREFPNAPLHSAAWEHDPKWLVLTVSLSKWLSEKSGVPVDFKFQPRTFANERHDGPRNPIGRYINHRPADEEG